MVRSARPIWVRLSASESAATITTEIARPASCGMLTTRFPTRQSALAPNSRGKVWRSEPQFATARCSNKIKKAIELTSGTNGPAPLIQRQVKASTMSATAAPAASAANTATGHGTPACTSPHVTMPPIINRAGMLKLRNRRIPMLSVMATPTIA